MSIKHTPGEWKVERWGYDDGKRVVPTIVAGGVDAVAQITNLYREDEEAADKEAAANGRLMATAPIMLKALEGVIHHNNATKPQYQLPKSLIRKVEAAIASAKGK